MQLDAALTLLVLAVIVLAFFVWAWQVRRSREIVARWAAANGYAVDAIERRYLRAGPFFFRRGRGHEVFYVSVRGADGVQRRAYVRTGGWFLGQMSEKVAVQWVD